MRDIIIREVEPSEYEDIYELNSLLGYEYPKDKTKQRILHILINTKDTVLVAVIDSEIVGYIHGSPYEVLYSDSFMDVLGLAVKEKFKGVGIGYLLLNRLENVAKERAFRCLIIKVWLGISNASI